MTHSDEAKQPDPIPAEPGAAGEPAPQEAEPTPDEAALAPEPPASAPAGRSLPVGAIAAAVAVAVLAAAGVATYPQWKDLLGSAGVEAPAPPVAAPPVAAPAADAQLRADLQALRARVAELERRPASAEAVADVTPRLGQVEAAVRALQDQPQVPARLVEDVAALAAQVAELRKTAADSSAVLRIADRLDKVEAELRDLRSRRSSAAALLLAVGQLREAVNHAMPFEAELRSVRALAPEDADFAQAVASLKPRAAAGIPTRMVLAERFHALAPALVRSDLMPEGQSWWRDTVNRMSSLLTVRREDGDAAGASPAAVVARAEAALRRGDLAGAVAQAETLTGAAAETVAPWLADAGARLAADKALSALTAQVVAAVGPKQ